MRPLLIFVLIATAMPGKVCEPDLAVRRVMAEADPLEDQRLSRIERTAERRKALDAGLGKRPEDLFLHAERQALELGRFGENRPDVLAAYEKRLAAGPASMERMYLVALAAYSHRTPRSLELLDRVLKRQPAYGPALLLRARIHASKAFRAEELVKADLQRFERACPASPALFPELAWLEDREFLAAHAARQRKVIAARVDLWALRAYPALWHSEKNSSRADERAGAQAAWDADIARIREVPAGGFSDPAVARSASRFRALWDAEFLLDKRLEGLERDANAVSPHGWPAPVVRVQEARKLPADEARVRFRELAQAYPASTGIVSHWISFARAARDDEALLEAYQFMKRAMELDPDAYLASPPFQITMAEEMVTRKMGLELVPQFAIAGLAAGSRVVGREVVSDLYPGDGRARKERDERWRLTAYFAMLEAYASLKREPEARDILSQAHAIIDRSRPAASASAGERGRFSWVEAHYWRVKGLVEESAGRPVEALDAYRAALATYPPRSARGDDRDAVAASARRLLKELGRETEALPTGWQDGHGGRNAWLSLAERRPGETIVAMDGKRYTPAELAKQVTFVNVWATWCGPVPGGTAVPGATGQALQRQSGRDCAQHRRRDRQGCSVYEVATVRVRHHSGTNIRL